MKSKFFGHNETLEKVIEHKIKKENVCVGKLIRLYAKKADYGS